MVIWQISRTCLIHKFFILELESLLVGWLVGRVVFKFDWFIHCCLQEKKPPRRFLINNSPQARDWLEDESGVSKDDLAKAAEKVDGVLFGVSV